MPEFDTPELIGFGVADYRSFGSDGFMVDKIAKINVFIGKNNSGKSNILRALRLLSHVASALGSSVPVDPRVDSHNRSGARPKILVRMSPGSFVPRDSPFREAISKAVPYWDIQWDPQTGEEPDSPQIRALDDRHLDWYDRAFGFKQQELFDPASVAARLFPRLCERATEALKMLRKPIFIPEFREIRGGQAQEGGVFQGQNIIARLRDMQHPAVGHEDQRETFREIQRLVSVLLDEPDLSLEIPGTEDVIYVNRQNVRLPLASFGTGLHELIILCVVLAFHKNSIVCIEEPEIHLHPELQRKFLHFIAEHTDNRYFITTHSNVFLDARQDVAIYHVTHDGTKSTVKRVEASPHAREVLTDLGFKASDLLQANCVVWVEGPSDRVYLNKWLSLLDPDLLEGIHYSVAFYGGKVLAHFAAADDPADDLVEVLRINRHAFLIMDKDNVCPDGSLNETKERVKAEIGEDHCWVTKGREIENYLSSALVQRFLATQCAQAATVTFDAEEHLEKAISTAIGDVGGPRVAYARAKVGYAREFCELMTTEDLDVLDLREQLTHLVDLIRRWNHMRPASESMAEPAEA